MAPDLGTKKLPQKKIYKRPRLKTYGRMKNLTTGGSGHAHEPSSGKKPRP